MLPSDGAVPVSSVGPTFWWGGTVTNPGPHALFGQAFLEVQFYPDAIVSNCDSAGGFNVTYAPDKFSVCTPVWQVGAKNFAETAAFNAELYDGLSSRPLVMDAGDTIRIHFFIASTAEGWHVQITDLTTGHSGTVVLNSKYGPLLPAFSQQKIGNALGWGLVDDTPDSFVWEIGHTSPFTSPAAQYCLPGQSICDSYDAAHWLRRQRHRHGLHLRRGLPGHPERLRPGQPVRHHAPVRRPLRPRFHLLRHRAEPGPVAPRPVSPVPLTVAWEMMVPLAALPR